MNPSNLKTMNGEGRQPGPGLTACRSDLSTFGRGSVFAGDSARTWHALNTCQKSGAALEVWAPNVSRVIRKVLIETIAALVLIAGGLVILNFIGRLM